MQSFRTFGWLLLASVLVLGPRSHAAEDRVLVYTRNGPKPDGKQGFVHDNIATSVAMIQKLGKDNNFAVDATNAPAVFTDANLKTYRVVVFANSNNRAFDTEEQKAAFQRFIRGGGGFVGIHSACGSERQWPWFWALLGGTFKRHPALQPFTIRVVDRQHPATAHLPETWQWEDEFYFLKEQPKDLHILLAGELAGLKDKQKPAGDTAPLAWCHEFEGGRAFYTSLGHKQEVYADPKFQQHILGGIRWAMGETTKEKK